jgi:mannosyltransferase
VIGDRFASRARPSDGDAAPAGSPEDETAGGSSPRRGRARLITGLLFAVPAVAELAVGGYRIGGPSLWRDEGYTLEAAHRSRGEILALLAHLDAVHGLYYLFMHYVVGVLGSSATALRLPSLLGMSAAAGMIAVVGRRLAVSSAVPSPPVIGMVAGLVFVAIPQTTYYAQDARPYGLTAFFAVTASYFLIRAAADGRWRWWTCYAAAIAVTTWSSLFALLLLVAHGVTVLAARFQPPSPEGAPARAAAPAVAGFRPPGLARWLVAAAGALLVVSPLFVLGYRQSGILTWITRPGAAAIMRMLSDLAGSRPLLPLVTVIALAGVASGVSAPRGELSLASMALPWLALPPLILLAASEVHPIYVERYVNFCVPAVALLVAAGLGWLVRQVARIPLGASSRVLAWLPSAALAVALVVLLVGPQQAARRTAARPDNLRAVAAVLSAHEQPGDAVFYLPSEARLISFSYPAPFRRLRDVALAGPVAASVTLIGVQVPPATVADRFAGASRVWTVTWSGKANLGSLGPTGRAELAMLSQLRMVQRWQLRSVVLTLYAR